MAGWITVAILGVMFVVWVVYAIRAIRRGEHIDQPNVGVGHTHVAPRSQEGTRN